MLLFLSLHFSSLNLFFLFNFSSFHLPIVMRSLPVDFHNSLAFFFDSKSGTHKGCTCHRNEQCVKEKKRKIFLSRKEQNHTGCVMFMCPGRSFVKSQKISSQISIFRKHHINNRMVLLEIKGIVRKCGELLNSWFPSWRHSSRRMNVHMRPAHVQHNSFCLDYYWHPI